MTDDNELTLDSLDEIRKHLTCQDVLHGISQLVINKAVFDKLEEEAKEVLNLTDPMLDVETPPVIPNNISIYNMIIRPSQFCPEHIIFLMNSTHCTGFIDLETGKIITLNTAPAPWELTYDRR